MGTQNNLIAVIVAFIKSHYLLITMSVCGVLLATLFLWIGFWKTILIVAMGVGGGVFGFWLDNRRKLSKQQDGYIFYSDDDV